MIKFHPHSYERTLTFNKQRRRVLATAGAVASTVVLGVPQTAGAPTPVVRRAGVALGSGGLHGYAHLGVIRAFESLGFTPDVITGTSVGAIAGVLWASGARADRIEALAGDPILHSARIGMPHLLGSDLNPLRLFIERNIEAKDIRDLRTRFAAVATDLATGKPVLLDRGSPALAVAASASMPIRNQPVRVSGRQLVDGALSAPVPVDAARRLAADFVVAVDVAYRPYEEPLERYDMAATAFQAMHIMINCLIREQLMRADFAIRLDLHRAMQGERGARDLIMVGERAARQAWPALRSRMAEGEPHNRQAPDHACAGVGRTPK